MSRIPILTTNLREALSLAHLKSKFKKTFSRRAILMYLFQMFFVKTDYGSVLFTSTALALITEKGLRV